MDRRHLPGRGSCLNTSEPQPDRTTAAALNLPRFTQPPPTQSLPSFDRLARPDCTIPPRHLCLVYCLQSCFLSLPTLSRQDCILPGSCFLAARLQEPGQTCDRKLECILACWDLVSYQKTDINISLATKARPPPSYVRLQTP